MTTINFNEVLDLSEDEVREHFEKARWPHGVACPRCGGIDPYKIKPKEGSKTRKGVYTCRACRRQFTVTVGTIFEGSHVSLKKWLLAACLMSASKKGISAHQIHRMLNVTYKTAWFMMHRLRYLMTQPALQKKLKGTVEVDETYIGGRRRGRRGRGAGNKMIVVSLVERKGNVRSWPIEKVTAKNLHACIEKNVEREAHLMTDDFPSYKGLDKKFAKHDVIHHGRREYVRGNVHTNTAEGFFSLLKRGVNGTFHHISREHLPFYLNEFDFRYNLRYVKDEERTAVLISRSEGKRLFYRELQS